MTPAARAQAGAPGGRAGLPAADRASLRRWPRGSVLVRCWPGGAPPAQYFQRLDPALPLAVCAGGLLYEEDEAAAAAAAGWSALPLLQIGA